ncbi:MAG: mobile mystery protein B [Methylotenera sp.]|nr:mobile mystery protein B [Oligoflexia bacterium]
MKFQFEYPEGATPLDPGEAAALLSSSISTQGELNEAEQANILSAQRWSMTSRLSRDPAEVLSDHFLRSFHQSMYGEVWKWAGQYRTTEKNIGIQSELIPMAMRDLCSDTAFWTENQAYPFDELAARYHHRLVQIHGFPNGNGRHARLMTDILLCAHGKVPFTWGATTDALDIRPKPDVRKIYIKALQDADQGLITPLMHFVRS